MIDKKDTKIKKGEVRNPKGRPKGTPNKTTTQLRELIATFVEKEIGQIETIVMGLEPRERAKFLTDLLKYAVPTLSSINMDANVKGTITKIEVSYKED